MIFRLSEKLRSLRTMGLSMAGAAALATVVFLPAQSAAEEEVVILGIWPLTGPYADMGPLLDRGVEIALVEVGY